MKFELDNMLIDDILFHMENQDGDFYLDVQEGYVVSVDFYDGDDEPDFSDNERFISLPEWTSHDGFRLMEKFAASLKNPVIREELSAALDRNRGVFRAFRDVLERYPETEKSWYTFKDEKMKKEIFSWYNSLREEWGLEPIGDEPEDSTSLVMEDFVIREGKASDADNAAALHQLCVNELKERYPNIDAPNNFPGDLCLVAETANEDFAGVLCAEKTQNTLQIIRLEIIPEYRGMGLAKTLLAKFLEKTGDQTITIDLPANNDFFSRALRLEGFKPCMQKFVRSGF
ncbi:MAG: GNAT family N-acetyltransferase [Treponema sp.]|jgi:GNAT superfamily N-acetyltransferase|nr:GNAT family N-acetyltransferase [Treponema sp.]